MSLILVPGTAALPCHLFVMQVLQLIQECRGVTQHSTICDTLEKLEKLVLRNRTEETQSAFDEATKETEDTTRSTRVLELHLLDARKKVAGLKNTLEHQKYKLRELHRSVDKCKSEKLELQQKLENETEHNTKISEELHSERDRCLQVSRDLASQKEYDLELADEVRSEKLRNTALLRDLETERQYNAELDVNCRDKRGNTALHRWATHLVTRFHDENTVPLVAS
jgi:chromosome segregation ATPase